MAMFRQGDSVIVSGKVTRGPFLKETWCGPVTEFGLMYGYDREKRTGLFVRVNIWGETGRIHAQRIQKGDHVCVLGEIESHVYDGKIYYDVKPDCLMAGLEVTDSMVKGKQRGREEDPEPKEDPWDRLMAAAQEMNGDGDLPF